MWSRRTSPTVETRYGDLFRGFDGARNDRGVLGFDEVRWATDALASELRHEGMCLTFSERHGTNSLFELHVRQRQQKIIKLYYSPITVVAYWGRSCL